MKIKTMTNFLKFFLGKRIIGITLCPFGVYIIEKYITDIYVINHESIHWKQQVEMLVIPFYIFYILEFFIKLFIYGGDAYRNLSFEREAYENDHNLEYLKNRRHYTWVKYIFHK